MRWITGTVKQVDLGPGFYGVVTDAGEEIRPINFPNQLKYEGKKVKLLIEPANEEFSMFMWGTAVTVRGFNTVFP